MSGNSITEIKEHPLVRHHLTALRDQRTDCVAFRRACGGLSRLLVAEAARGLELKGLAIETPLEPVTGERLAESVVFVPILRAGLGMMDAALETIPGAVVGHLGLERDEATAEAGFYYRKMPGAVSTRPVMVLDPMLATGGSAVHAVDALKAAGAQRITMVSIIAAPEGVAYLRKEHPDVALVVGVIDRELDAKKYIRPGLGDFGDRLFGTD